jgi:hypothetical protein
MQRNGRSMTDSLSWLGEQAQTQFLDRNLDKHRGLTRTNSNSSGCESFSSSSPYASYQKLTSYQSLDFDQKHTIRHQVIVWSVGIPDVKTHTVTITFRVTLFWNNPPPLAVVPPLKAPLLNGTGSTEGQQQEQQPRQQQQSNTNASDDASTSAKSNNHNNHITNNNNNNDSNKGSGSDDSYWVMDGRRKAIRRRRTPSISETSNGMSSNRGSTNTTTTEEHDTIDVPPISIINADTFEVVGAPDITVLRKKSRLMRFSCMYRARLQQDSMNVCQFPHDSHDLVLKLGILAQRQKGDTWDRRKWKLGLANDSDTQGSIRVPFGVLVDHVAVPGFQISDRGLEFELEPIDYGSNAAAATMNMSAGSNSGLDAETFNQYHHHHQDDQDFCVKATIRVKRNSAYYDRNIMPLLDILNLVSISILVSLDAEHFFQRGLLCLNIAFVEVGLRTSLDARLPTVGYEIKMQKILNSYFFSILYIVLESAVMKVLTENHDWPVEWTRIVDLSVAFFLMVNQFYLRMVIYKDFSAMDEFNEFS